MEPHEIITLATEILGGKFVLDRTGKFFDAIIGEAGKDVYAGGKDWWTNWSRENIARVFHRSAELLDIAKIFPKPVPPDILIRLMEAAAKTGDPTLSEMFAQLLAKAASDMPEANHPIYCDTLRRMSGTDAQIFQIVIEKLTTLEHHRPVEHRKENKFEIDGDTIAEVALKKGFKREAVDFALDNLERLDLLEFTVRESGNNYFIGLLKFGQRFADLCLPSGSQATPP